MPPRRLVLALLAGLPLAACNARGPAQVAAVDPDAAWYIGTMPDQPYDVPLVDRSRMDAKYRPQTVAYTGLEKPGTVVVDIDERFLYLVQEGGQARRYGVGVGKLGFSWKGTATVGRKGVWPDWGPTAKMVSLNPDLPRTAKAASTTRWAPAPSTSTRAAATSCSASTAPTSPGASASRCPRAACACSTRTWSISTTACRSARP